MSRRRSPEQVAKREERRSELIEAAVRVISRDGPDVSMDDIASEAGITKPILYRHFGDKGGLASAVGDRFSAELLATLRGSLLASAEPRELLETTIDAYVTFVERDTNIYRFLMRSLGEGPGRSLVGFIRQVGAEVSVVLGEQLRAVGADSGAAEPWAYGLVGMVHLAGDWWVERRTMPRERLVQYLTALVWEGLAIFDTARPARPISVLKEA